MTAKTLRATALTAVSALSLLACDFDIANPNSPDAIGPNPTRGRVVAAATGLLIGSRTYYPGFILNTSIIGRDGYRVDGSEPLALALSHGANDAQKTMGIITLALVTGGYLKEFTVPLWVILLCGTMIGLGTSLGGWKLINTLGRKFYKIRPVHGLCISIDICRCDPDSISGRRTCKHHPGGQFRDLRCGRCGSLV